MVRKHATEPRGVARTKADAAVVPAGDKPKRKMRVTDNRRLRECLRLQKASYGKSPLNATQFRRLVAEVMREKGAGKRISKRALQPLMHIACTDLHHVLTAARYISNVSGKKSVGLRSINLAEALLLRPQLVTAGPPIDTESFDDPVKGLSIDFTQPGQKAAAEKKKAKKKQSKKEKAPPAEPQAEEKKDEDEDEDEEAEAEEEEEEEEDE